MTVYAETFLTRKQYDLMLTEMAGFAKCTYPLLKKEWCLAGVRVIAYKPQLVQHISKLNAFKRDYPVK